MRGLNKILYLFAEGDWDSWPSSGRPRKTIPKIL
jgi:hypothetical protein